MSVLCTWHDSWTTVACIKLWPYQFVRVKTKAKIFHRRFQLWKHKPSWNGSMITMAAFNRRNFQGDCIINISVTPCYKLYCHKTSLKINVPANGLTIDRKPCYYLNNLLIISLLKSFPLTHRGGVTHVYVIKLSNHWISLFRHKYLRTLGGSPKVIHFWTHFIQNTMFW